MSVCKMKRDQKSLFHLGLRREDKRKIKTVCSGARVLRVCVMTG